MLSPILALAIKPEFEEWSQEEMDFANTAKDAPISDECKLVYLYCNLARMDGEKFAKTYLDRYAPQIPWTPNPIYLNSLYDDLKDVKGLARLQYSGGLKAAADFHSVDMGTKGLVSHSSSDGTDCYDRICRFVGPGHHAECCSYGYASALGIVLQLLVDDNVESLGHRYAVLNPSLNRLGVAIAPHQVHRHTCVLDFSEGKTEDVPMPESKPVPAYKSYKPTETFEEYHRNPLNCWLVNGSANPNQEILTASNHQVQKSNQAATPYRQNSYSESAYKESTYKQSSYRQSVPYRPKVVPTPILLRPVFHPGAVIVTRQPMRVVAVTRAVPPAKRHTTKDCYYEHCGRRFLAIGKIGYTYSFPEEAHMINGGAISFRAGLFGLSLFDCELSVSPKTNSFNWHPSMRVYIPTSRATSLSLYTGATVEAKSAFNRINEGKDYEPEDFFVSPLAGLSFELQPLRIMPISIFCEYRHRLYQNDNHIESNIIGDRHGVYVGTQLSLGISRRH